MQPYVPTHSGAFAPHSSTPQRPPQPPAMLSTLHAALHGGLPPAMLTAHMAATDSDSDSEEVPSPIGRARNGSDTPYNPYAFATQASSRGTASLARSTAVALGSPAQSHGSTAGSSSSGGRIVRPTCAVLDVQRAIEVRERAGSRIRRFRARDASTRDRLFNVDTAAMGGACVTCNAGSALWSVLPAPAGAGARARILRKESSPYYIVLQAHVWATHLKRRALGYLHAVPELRRLPALAIEVNGDALAKRFELYGRDGGTVSSLAQARRSTKLATIDGAVRELTTWSVTVERNVDCTMVAAILYVIEEWCSGDGV